MLSAPDFKQKQILFIESFEEKKIRFQNSNLVIEQEEKIITQVPCAKIFAVFFVGGMSFTSVIVQKFLDYGVSLFFLNGNYRTYATLAPSTEGNTLLRKKQYSLENPLLIAKKIIFNKTENQIALLKSIRQKSEEEKSAIKSLQELQEKMKNANSNEELLGLEGSAAKAFFQVYFKDLKWRGRKPRTKYDIPNTLLDVGYTILFNFLEAHLRLYGFDIYCGVYHQFFYERKSLVCDIEEPFRCIIDHALRNAFALGQVDEKDFRIEGHQYILDYKKSRKYAKIFLEAIIKHKEEIFLYCQKYYRSFMKQDFENIPSFVIRNS